MDGVNRSRCDAEASEIKREIQVIWDQVAQELTTTTPQLAMSFART